MAQDEVTIDLTNYKDRVGSRVIPGRYRVRVSDAELDKTKAGDPMINVWLDVIGGEFEGSTVIDRLLPAHPKAQFRVVGFMQALGIPTPKKRLRLIPAQWVGKQLDVDIEDGEPYNGKVKSEIRGYYRLAKGTEAAVADLEDDGPEDAPIDPLDLPEDLEDAAEAEAEIAQAPDPEPAPASVPGTPAPARQRVKAAPAEAVPGPTLAEQVAARQAATQGEDPSLGEDSEDGADFEVVDLENLELD